MNAPHNRKVIINLFGQSCAGKSTAAGLIQQAVPGLYTLDWDIVKDRLSDYYWKRDRPLIMTISVGYLKTLTETGIPILMMLPLPANEDEYRERARLVQEHGYELINVELKAPKNVLIERYAERLRQRVADGDIRNFKTQEEYEEALMRPFYRPEDTISFDTSSQDPQIIADRLISVAGLAK